MRGNLLLLGVVLGIFLGIGISLNHSLHQASIANIKYRITSRNLIVEHVKKNGGLQPYDVQLIAELDRRIVEDAISLGILPEVIGDLRNDKGILVAPTTNEVEVENE